MVEIPNWVFAVCAMSGLLIVVAELVSPIQDSISSFGMATSGLLVMICSLAGMLGGHRH